MFNMQRSLWIVTAILIIVLLGFPSFVHFYTNYLWFDALGFRSVFLRRISFEVGLGILVAVVSFFFLFTCWRRARKIALRDTFASYDSPLTQPVAGFAIAGISGIVAIANGLEARTQWETLWRFIRAVSFDRADPIFGNDVGFYIFRLPFYSFLQGWLLALLGVALVGAAVILLADRVRESRESGSFWISKAAQAYLGTLAGGIALLLCVGHWLGRYNLLYSTRGVVFGASYTDVHAELLALNALVAVTGILAVLLPISARRRSWKAPLLLVGVWLGVSIVLRGLYPGIVQRYAVEPNEFQRERPYIEYNIAATLYAFDLENLSSLSMVPAREVTAKDVEENAETLRNVRLWDFAPLLRSYRQLQEIRSYYEFYGIDVDRYELGDERRQLMLSPRELDLRQLQSPTWVNLHLEFTHGYGVVASPVNEVTSTGQPIFFIKDLPPESSVPIQVERPQIYYGESPSSYVLVKTSVKEFDYPMGDANVRTTYEGSGGVPVGSLWRRLLFATRFGDSRILFTDAILPESRIMFYRTINERVRRVAPFLRYDGDPYLVIAEGRLFWVQDAYTVTGRYPYAEPIAISTDGGGREWINYIRNSVKVVVDAYNGSLDFYIADENDPLVRSWSAIFPGLFKSSSEMPAWLLSHRRYPMDLFSIQSEVYRTYHMTDPNTFYNKEDLWISPVKDGKPMPPYYITMRLAEENEAEFLIATPFLPVGKNNMIAWMAGRCDGDNYGELVVYEFPKQELIFGPSQVEALIDQHPEISSQLSLWGQRGSDVIRGQLMVIPLGDSILYVQPLYLRAENSDLPELKRVIVSTGGRVAWAQYFDDALSILLGTAPQRRPAVESEAVSRPEGIGAPDVSSLVREASESWTEAKEALSDGNWVEYGKALERLEEALRRLEEAVKGQGEQNP